MAEELIKTDNGAGASHAPAKKATRKTTKKMEDNKMDETLVKQEFVEQAPKAQAATAKAELAKEKQAVKKTAAKVQKAVADTKVAADAKAKTKVAEVKHVVEEAKLPAKDSEPVMSIKKLVKDASAQVERLPGSKQVREAVTKVADQVGNNKMTKKTMNRMRDGMREATDQVKQGAQELEKNPLVIAAHKVLLASVGAAALAQEEIEDFVNRLIERGSIAEADGKRMVKDVLDQRRKQMERAGERAQEVATEVRSNLSDGPKRLADDLEQRIENVLGRMNIPTKDEIETLTSKITALTHKVDELKKPE